MEISRVAKWNKLHPQTLEKQYKNKLSDYGKWKKEVDEEALIYPENFGEKMSLDEVALHNGELYTVITNKEANGRKGCLGGLIKGTKAEVVSKALEEVPVSVRYGVKEITLDLANTMDWISRTNFPNATMVADRFHFQKIVSEAVQEVRIKLRREAIDEENEKIVECRSKKIKYESPRYANGDTKKQLLARSRYLLFKPKSRWTTSQCERAEILFKEFPEIKKVYEYSMYFRSIFEYSSTRVEGKRRLDKWYKKVDKSNITTLISAAHSIKNNEGKVLNYLYRRATNASAESFNAKLKGFRSLVRGVSDLKFFLFRIHTFFS